MSQRKNGTSTVPPPGTIARDDSRMRRSHGDSMMKKSRFKDSPKHSTIKPRHDPGPPRETIISFCDDPGVIHRGEILPFHTLKKKDVGLHSKGKHAQDLGDSGSGSRSLSPDRKSWGKQ